MLVIICAGGSVNVRWPWHVTRMGDMRIVYKILVGIPEGKIFGRPRRRWEDNIKMNLY